jgi:hypothetical protein
MFDATGTMHMTMLEFTGFGGTHALYLNHVLENLARKFMVEIHGHALARRFHHPSREGISADILRKKLRADFQVRPNRKARGWHGLTLAGVVLAIRILD